MIGVIKGYYSSDIEDLKGWKPSELADIYFSLEICIGPPDKSSSQLFELLIASPEALRKRMSNADCISGRHILIVSQYKWELIQAWIENTVRTNAEETWEKIAVRLSREFRWEYEDYKEDL